MMSVNQGSFESTTHTGKRVLVVSYAFPPLQVQMSPVAARTVAALKYAGFSVDVITAKNFLAFMPLDRSLLSYVKKNASSINYVSLKGWFGKWQSKRPNWLTADIMHCMNNSAFNKLMSIELESYEAIVTLSPFHSINNVMLRLKKRRPTVRWVAYFCDPWAGNPLEDYWFRRFWSDRYEPKMLSAADFIANASQVSLDMILQRNNHLDVSRTRVISHFFDPDLYPNRPKADNKTVVIRFVGTLFSKRTPEPLLRAAVNLLEQRPDLKYKFVIELIGKIDASMLDSNAAISLSDKTVYYKPPVNYLKSLELMYDADVLVLIEADTDTNLFVPSKLIDYLGSGTPIVGITNSGNIQNTLQELGFLTVHPRNIQGIQTIIEKLIDLKLSGQVISQANEAYKNLFSIESISSQWASVICNLN